MDIHSQDVITVTTGVNAGVGVATPSLLLLSAGVSLAMQVSLFLRVRGDPRCSMLFASATGRICCFVMTEVAVARQASLLVQC